MRWGIKRFLREAGFDVGVTKKISEDEVIKYFSEKQDFSDTAIYYWGAFGLTATHMEEGRIFEASIYNRDLLLQSKSYLDGSLIVVYGIYPNPFGLAIAVKEALFKIGRNQSVKKMVSPYANSNVIHMEVSDLGEKIIEGHTPEPIKMSLDLLTEDAFYHVSRKLK